MSLIDIFKILEQIHNSINKLSISTNSTIIKKKCISVLTKNKGLKVLKQILNILQGINFNDLSVPNYLPDILANALITNVDIERSTTYKYIFTNHCYNFTELNMEHL